LCQFHQKGVGSTLNHLYLQPSCELLNLACNQIIVGEGFSRLNVFSGVFLPLII
jgi:hypothetical protein